MSYGTPNITSTLLNGQTTHRITLLQSILYLIEVHVYGMMAQEGTYNFYKSVNQ